MYKSIINEKFVSLVSNKVVRNDVLMNDDVNSYTSNLAGKKKFLYQGPIIYKLLSTSPDALPLSYKTILIH